MNKTILIIFSLFLLSCADKQNTNLQENQFSKDSTLYYYRFSKNKNHSNIDRLKAINKALLHSKKKRTDSLFLKALHQKSIIHLALKHYDSFFNNNTFLLKHAKIYKDKFYLGKHHYLKAYYYHTVTNQYDSAFYYYNQSKTYFKALNNHSQVGKRLLNMALIQKTKNDYIGSKETITEALQYLQKKDSKYIASSYSVLADNHRKLLNPLDAIKYYQQAISITKSEKDKLVYQNNLAIVYIDTEQYQNAIVLLKTIEQDSLLRKNSNQYARVIDNLGYAQWLNNKATKPELLLKALHIRLKNNDKRGLIASYIHLGLYFSDTEPLKAEKYLNNAIKVSKQLKIPKGELEALQVLMKLKPKSVVFKDRYILLNDSLYEQGLKAKTQFAKMKYDDETKQKAILKLETEKAKQTLEVAKQHTQKTIYLFSGIILVITGGFLFYIIKQRHKKDKLNEVYNTETRISQQVHDELANDVYHVINKIQNKTQQKDVLNQLESIYEKTRDISYKNGTINLDNNYFYLELKELLSSYQNDKTKVSTIGLNKEFWSTTNNHKKIATVRVLKELLTNMKKHSNASQVVITFKKDKQNINIRYVDNGIGIKKSAHFKNNGLQNAENRIKNINGSFNFDLNRKSGLGITISFSI